SMFLNLDLLQLRAKLCGANTRKVCVMCFSKEYDKALEDASKTGYNRKGAALHGLGKLDKVRETYKRGLKIELSSKKPSIMKHADS
ncbi:5996_t:CDS:2, partial [Scutellospora calospora]